MNKYEAVYAFERMRRFKEGSPAISTYDRPAFPLIIAKLASRKEEERERFLYELIYDGSETGLISELIYYDDIDRYINEHIKWFAAYGKKSLFKAYIDDDDLMAASKLAWNDVDETARLLYRYFSNQGLRLA